MKDTIRKHAVLNAVKYDGKANPGAVIGAVMAEMPIAKKDMKKLNQAIKKEIELINTIPLEDLQKEAENYEVKTREKSGTFDFMKIPKDTVVISCFPPEPSKYFHIGHAKSLYVNYLLAKEHKGKFILRFDDTNPELAKKEFYDKQLRDIAWLGIKPDKIVYASDFLNKIDDFALKLIKQGHAYVCSCPQETVSENRKKQQHCEHVNRKDNMDAFLHLEQGSVLRLNLDMKNKNSTFRDPVIYRVIEAHHPRTRERSIWPAYDFETAVLDGLLNINYRIRGKEFELRSALQQKIQELLRLPITHTYEYARFEIKGGESSGRKIREGIEKGEFSGWDDPRLVTLRALRRRGFLPEAIKNFLLSTGFSKAESTLTWEDLYKHNRRILDKEAKRLFFIEKPKEIIIKNAPAKSVELNLNPNDKKGGRKFKTKGKFLIEEKDFNKIKTNKIYRLMDCLNFTKKGNDLVFVEGGVEEYRKNGAGILHWLTSDFEEVKILMPDNKEIFGIAEKTTNLLEIDEIIQFERFGFCRVDSPNSFWYTHK